jgi:hypothetical protein
MKTFLRILFLLAAFGPVARAQVKINDWDYAGPFAFGGTSAGATDGGFIQITGTTYRSHRPANMQGGDLIAWGGQWLGAGVTVPKLRAQTSGTNVVLAWPDPSTRYQLYKSAEVTPFAWTPITSLPAIVGAEKRVTLPHSARKEFFQLYKPW